MISKDCSVIELKTLFQITHDQINEILVSTASHNNDQYYQNFTSISLRTLKYISHYLNQIIFDQILGGLIDGIISSLSYSLTQYKSRNIFVSSTILSPLAINQEEQKEEDQIYHFMNTRNNNIPFQLLAGSEIDRQRMELAQFVQSMETKKIFINEAKKGVQLPHKITQKIQTAKKLTYDPNLRPIAQQDKLQNDNQMLPEIQTVISRNNEQAQTQTEIMGFEWEKQTQKELDQHKSQAEVSEAADSRLSNTQDQLELKSAAKSVFQKKKGKSNNDNSNDSKINKLKKKNKIMESLVPAYFSRQGSRKGTKMQQSTSRVKDLSNFSLKYLKNQKESLAIKSQEVCITFNLQNSNNNLNQLEKENLQNQNQQQNTEIQPKQIELKQQNLMNNMMDIIISQGNQQDSHLQSQKHNTQIKPSDQSQNLMKNSNQGQQDFNKVKRSQQKSNLTKILNNANLLPSIPVTNNLAVENFGNSSIESSNEKDTNQLKNRFSNKRLTVLNMKFVGQSQPLQVTQQVRQIQIRQSKRPTLLMRSPLNVQISSRQSIKKNSLNNSKINQKEKEMNALQSLIQQGERGSLAQSQHLEDITSNFSKQKPILVEDSINNKVEKRISGNQCFTKSFMGKFNPSSESFNRSVGFSLNKQQSIKNRGSLDSEPMILISSKSCIRPQKIECFIDKNGIQIKKIRIDKNSMLLSPVNLKQFQRLSQNLEEKPHQNSLVNNNNNYIDQPNNKYSQQRSLPILAPQQKENISSPYLKKNYLNHYKSPLSTINQGQFTKNQSRKYQKCATSSKSGNSVHLGMNQTEIYQITKELRHRGRQQAFSQYLQMIQITHRKFCGSKCQHIQNLYKKISENGTKIEENVLDQLIRIMKKQKVK